MTKEEKAKAYDKALERAEKALEVFGTDKCEGARQIFSLFPELKESEDEKVRKALLELVHDTTGDELLGDYKVYKEEALAWLEKQRNVQRQIDDAYLEGMSAAKHELEKQGDKDKLIKELGKYKVKYTQEVLEKHINSMSNKDDERLRKTTIAFLKDFADKGYENAVECIDWLEEQNSCSTNDDCSELLNKEETLNKLKLPKFKVGDIIKHNKANIICKVISVNTGSYYLKNIETDGNIELFNAEKNFHLWTIEDAKKGDVLVASDGSIFLYNYTEDGYAKCYYVISKEGDWSAMSDGEDFGEEGDACRPATKEERDLLFDTLTSEGYVWDAENLKLKKIKEESNFKVGDWIMSNVNENRPNRIIAQITSIRNLLYYIRDIDGSEGYETWDSLRDNYHLWTIEDAKDGDILTTPGFTFIFKNIAVKGGVRYYCANEDVLHEGDETAFHIAIPDSLMGNVNNNISKYAPATIEQCELLFEKMEEAGYMWDEDNLEVKKIKKSKFNIGDYIKHNKANIICKIISVNSGSYYVENIMTNGGIELFNAEQNFHLWTIQDAKNGDVLAAGDWVCIFKEFHINGFPKCHCHYDLTLEEFKVDTDSYMASGGDIYPATKEQRELLFSKMEEAGYKWDADNLELTEKFFKTLEESLGISSEEYNKIINDCLFSDDDKPTIRERYENIKDSEWFKKTHENMPAGIDGEVAEMKYMKMTSECDKYGNIYGLNAPTNIQLMDKINELVGEVNNIKQELKDLTANAS